MIVQDEGGTHILAYEITVILGSIPFITFLTWRARILGLNKRSAFFITAYLCGVVMLLPWALRIGWLNWWIISIVVLFIAASKIKGYAEDNSNEEIFEQIQMKVLVPESPVKMEENIFSLPIDELIDLGFKEKDSENFEQAATYFSHALSQNPTSDLAFSLIIDCYWLWSNLGERDYALTQLPVYVQKYLPLFDTELRLQFDTWIVKEDLQIILE